VTRLVVAVAAAVALLAGCGGGAGSGKATLWVTRDEGRQVLLVRTVPAGETAMQALERSVKLSTRYGGRFVQSIDGVSGSIGSRHDWFYFVNGIEAPKGAAATRLRPGDAIWWDRRDWTAAQRTPAVVGAFPEPFVHGPATPKRLPVRVECAEVGSAACRAVTRSLVGYDVPAATGTIGSSFTEQTLRVLVGTWLQVRGDPTAALLEGGPRDSGVYAEPSGDGRTLTLLDARGRTTRTLRAGAGLIAAARSGEDPPVWVVTGTDAAGLAGAAASFNRAALRRHYALATAAGAPVAVPVTKAGA